MVRSSRHELLPAVRDHRIALRWHWNVGILLLLLIQKSNSLLVMICYFYDWAENFWSQTPVPLEWYRRVRATIHLGQIASLKFFLFSFKWPRFRVNIRENKRVLVAPDSAQAHYNALQIMHYLSVLGEIKTILRESIRQELLERHGNTSSF